MWWEIDSMLNRMVPTNWGPTKVALVLSFLMVLLAVLLVRLRSRRLEMLHVAFVNIGAVSILANFLYGGFNRGFFGTAFTQPHSELWKITLVTHAGFSVVFFLCYLFLLNTGLRIRRKKAELRHYVWHRRVGYVALGSLGIVAFLALPL